MLSSSSASDDRSSLHGGYWNGDFLFYFIIIVLKNPRLVWTKYRLWPTSVLSILSTIQDIWVWFQLIRWSSRRGQSKQAPLQLISAVWVVREQRNWPVEEFVVHHHHHHQDQDQDQDQDHHTLMNMIIIWSRCWLDVDEDVPLQYSPSYLNRLGE